MFRSRSWFGSGWNRPKNRLSLEHLKYLSSVLEKNTTVSENNRGLLVESLRSIAEILIWGDQNDSSVFDFFLEKNMLSYFLHIMRQRGGASSFVCVQLLQTLNILFENIRNETSLYYLLSNNHVNSIIVHKFDFSDEDVMGYYILFLKTLSFKLNIHTIHFFYNEHTNDFPLYTEAIKFFNHPESMVRIAVRTITLNVYKVRNINMLRFIRDKTAAPYFSNLVWFIGKHILELDSCVRSDTDHQSQNRLSNLVAEHLDHLHYLNDILCLEISDLNAVLTEHLLHKLFVPLYIFSLTPTPPLSMALVAQNLAAVLNKPIDIDIQEINNPRVSLIVALYLLSLVFLVITHGPLVHSLAWVILNADQSVFKEGAVQLLNEHDEKRDAVCLGFGQPSESLEEALDIIVASTSASSSTEETEHYSDESSVDQNESEKSSSQIHKLKNVNVTDEEKEKLKMLNSSTTDISRPFLEIILQSIDCSENDYLALLGLCLIYALLNNKGVNPEWFQQILSRSFKGINNYKTILIDNLLNIINLSSQQSCRIRLITLELTLDLLLNFVKSNDSGDSLTESQRQILLQSKNQAIAILRNFYKTEDIFLDLFEDEFNENQKSHLNVEFLCMDSTILLPPTGTPLTGINFTRRLPCGDVEKARRAIRVFLLLRTKFQEFFNEKEMFLPLTNLNNYVQLENVLDLNNSDLIACTVITKESIKHRRFLVIDNLQLILVEPDSKRLGWGVTKFVGFLQDVEVSGDKDDSRCLHITVHRGGVTHNRTPMLSAKFLFDDHIRCMAAKQRLTKGRTKARQKKMYQIAQLLGISGQSVDSTASSLSELAIDQEGTSSKISKDNRPLFLTASRVPGFAAALKRDNVPNRTVSRFQMAQNRSVEGAQGENVGRSRRRYSNSSSHSNTKSGTRCEASSSCDRKLNSRGKSNQSPSSKDDNIKIQRKRSEEIPLEDFPNSYNSNPVSCETSNMSTRSNTPSDSVPSLSSCDKTKKVSTYEVQIAQNSTMAQNNDLSNSRETSFIANEERDKRKGKVEII